MAGGGVVGAGISGVDIISVGLWLVEKKSSRSNPAQARAGDADISHEMSPSQT